MNYSMKSLVLVAAAASLAGGGVSLRTTGKVTDPRLSPRRLRAPNGCSFRSLRLATNSGWVQPQPSEKAKLRHAWYRRKLAWDALREKLGQ